MSKKKISKKKEINLACTEDELNTECYQGLLEEESLKVKDENKKLKKENYTKDIVINKMGGSINDLNSQLTELKNEKEKLQDLMEEKEITKHKNSSERKKKISSIINNINMLTEQDKLESEMEAEAIFNEIINRNSFSNKL